MNKVFFAGRLCADPELKVINENNLCSMRVAVNIFQKKKDGDTDKNSDDSTVFYTVNVWGARGETCAKYLKKGNFVVVSGDLSKPRTYLSKDGMTTNVALDVRADSVDFGPSAVAATANAQNPAATQSYVASTTENDDVPF